MNVTRLMVGLLVLAGGAWTLRSRREDVKKAVVERLLERPVQGRRYAELADELAVAGERLNVRLDRSGQGEAARRALRHIVGIERWGQRRLRVALGEPFVRDEHHPYKPPRDAGWDELCAAFHATRTETVDLARALSISPPAPEWRVEHNGLGPLSARGWLRYLQTHAELESRRIR